MRTSVIDAADVDEGFEAPQLGQVVIGPEIAILYEAEVPVLDGEYDATVLVSHRIVDSNHGSLFLTNEGSADGETTRFTGHASLNTDDFTPGDLIVSVAVEPSSSLGFTPDAEFRIPVVTQTEDGDEG